MKLYHFLLFNLILGLEGQDNELYQVGPPSTNGNPYWDTEDAPLNLGNEEARDQARDAVDPLQTAF